MDKLIQAEMRLTAKRIARMMEKNPIKYDKTKKYAELFLTTIRPLRYFLLIQGQYPFAVKEYETKPTSFYGKWATQMNFIYLFFFFTGCFNFLVISFGYFTFFVNVFDLPPTQVFVVQENINQLGTEVKVPKDWERLSIRQGFSPLIVMYLWLIYLMIMNVTLFIRRRAFLNYLNYWLFSFQMMQMEVLETVFYKMLMEIFFAVGFMVLLLIVSFSNVVPSISSMLDVLSFLYLRPLHYLLDDFPVPPAIINKDKSSGMFYVYKFPGALIMCMAYVGARSAVIHLIFYNRLLAGISATWNQRMRDGLVQNEVLSGKMVDTSTHPKIRIDLRFLLDDHYNIVQLYKMTEDIFGWQLIVYYFLEALSLIFELYHMVSVYSTEKVIDGRYGINAAETLGIYEKRLNLKVTQEESTRATGEFYLALMSSILTSINIFITTDCANAAYVEGMGGFQVLRRNCYLGSCDTTQERNFIHSMIVSYAPNNPIQISANGFFDVNRSLIGAVMINVMGYLVACYTLKPDTSEFWNYGQYANLCQPKKLLSTCK